MTLPSPARLSPKAALLNREEVRYVAAEWDNLAEQASEPNSFYERWFLEPSLGHLDPPDSLKILTVRDGTGVLIGLLPLRTGRTYGRTRIAAVENWLHYNQFLGAPLVLRGAEHKFWETALPLIDQTVSANILYLSEMPSDSAVTRALFDVCRRKRRPNAIVHRYTRALLVAGETADAYWASTVRKKKRKEIARLENRLAEMGVIRIETLRSLDGADAWLAAFLDLEARGWKGKDGAALALEASHSAFFRDALRTALGMGRAEIVRLTCGDDVIAMLVNFLAGAGSFSFKIAYDERYARFSPGILIEKANLQRLNDPAFGWMDSCAVENHPMINSLWRYRREMVRIALPLAGMKSAMLFRAARAAETSWSTIKQLRTRSTPKETQVHHDEL